MAKKSSKTEVKEIPIESIERPSEVVRIEIAEKELNELAASIKERGLLQPILVTKRGEKYEIIAGDRRYLAHKILGKTKILSIISSASEKEVLVDRAIENLQREQLTPLEEGKIYISLQEKMKMTLDDIAKMTGKSPGTVKRRMDILRMPESFRVAVHSKLISLTVAEELWSCSDEAHREYLLDMAVDHGITREVARQWVQDYRKLQRSSGKVNGDPGGTPSALPEEKIYRSCQCCRGPIELMKTKELRLCPECFTEIIEVIQTKPT